MSSHCGNKENGMSMQCEFYVIIWSYISCGNEAYYLLLSNSLQDWICNCVIATCRHQKLLNLWPLIEHEPQIIRRLKWRIISHFWLCLEGEVPLTHGQRNTAGSQDLPVGFPDALAGVLQVVHVHVDVPNVGHHEGLIRCCPGAAVARSQQGRFHSDLPGTKPAVGKGICGISFQCSCKANWFWTAINNILRYLYFNLVFPFYGTLHFYCTTFDREISYFLLHPCDSYFSV